MKNMMTRSEMYQLVWAEPRTALAKRFGISDVAIAKHCRNANIPMPPPGYWARKASGKRVIQPALPLRLPGQTDRVFATDEDRYGYGYDSRKEDLNSAPEPPRFHEPLELLIAEAVKQVGKVQACKDLENPHPGLGRVLASERRRRETWEAQKPHDYYRPYFDEPVFQRQLRLMNSLLWAFERIQCKGEVISMDGWVQGFGQFHSLRARVCIGSTHVAFEFLEPSNPKAIKRAPPTGVTTLRVAANSSGDLDWCDQPGCKLEKQLTAVAAAMLELAETWLRRNAMDIYERRVELRQAMLRAIEAKKEDDEKRRLAAIEQHHRDNRDRLRKLASEHQSAREIRSLVEAIRMHPECNGSNLASFVEWEREVLAFADSIDPVTGPIERIIASYSKYPETPQ